MNPTIKGAIRSILDDLKTDPFLGKALQGDFIGLRSLRFKRYRVIYRVDAKHRVLQILLAGQRTNIYDELSRALKSLGQ